MTCLYGSLASHSLVYHTYLSFVVIKWMLFPEELVNIFVSLLWDEVGVLIVQLGMFSGITAFSFHKIMNLCLVSLDDLLKDDWCQRSFLVATLEGKKILCYFQVGKLYILSNSILLLRLYLVWAYFIVRYRGLHLVKAPHNSLFLGFST